MGATGAEPAQVPLPSPRARRSLIAPATGAGMGLVLALSSLWGKAPFLSAIAALAAMTALDGAALFQAGNVATSRWTMAAGAVLLPLAASFGGEPWVAFAAALAVMILAATNVAAGLRKDTLLRIAASCFVALYAGLVAAFAELLRTSALGHRLFMAYLLILAGYHVGSWIGGTRIGGSAVVPSLGTSPTWWATVFGMAGSLLGAALALTFMGPGFGGPAAAALGSIVGLSALLGDLSGRMMRADLGVGERRASVPGLGGLLARIDTVILSLPAFYYGFKLYLT